MARMDKEWEQVGGEHRAFVLRCWHQRESLTAGEPGRDLGWRFVLMEVGDEPGRQGFTCLDELMLHLRGRLSATEAGAGDPRPDGGRDRGSR